MISRLSNWVVTLLCKSGTISTDEQELYIYGFFLLFSRLVFLILTAIFGCMLGVLWESILFYIIFSALREYAGGIHASKEWVCQISTTLLMLLCVAGIHFQEVKGCTGVSLLLLLQGSVTVFLLSPLDSEEKPLTPSECRYYRKISRGIVTILGLAALGLALLHEFVFLYISTMTVLSEGGVIDPRESKDGKDEKMEADAGSNLQKEIGAMKKTFFHIAGICVLAGALAFINHHIFSLAIVNGDSMYPTLKEGNIIAVDRVHRIPERGDIVLIRVPPAEFGAEYYVERVVGIGGENIRIDYNGNLVYINGKPLVEPYLNRTQGDPMLPPRWESKKSYDVPAGTVFVMGDNRNYSSDSRDPLLGFVNMEDIVGVAVGK